MDLTDRAVDHQRRLRNPLVDLPVVSDCPTDKIVEEEPRNILDGLHDVGPCADDGRDEDLQCVNPL